MGDRCPARRVFYQSQLCTEMKVFTTYLGQVANHSERDCRNKVQRRHVESISRESTVIATDLANCGRGINICLRLLWARYVE